MERITTYTQGSLFRAETTLKSASQGALSHVRRSTRHSSVIMAYQNGAVMLVEEMREVHTDWVDAKFEPFAPYLQKIGRTPDEVEERVQDEYSAGLKSCVAFLLKDHADIPEQDVIVGYTAGFIRMVRLGNDLGLTPKTALKLAKQSYLLDASAFRALIKNNSDILRSHITNAALHHSKDPAGYLNDFRKRVRMLSTDERYQDLNQSLVMSAAGRKDPESFLDNFKANCQRLEQDRRYRHLPISAIENAAQGHPKNPDAFLDECIETAEKLSRDSRYSRLSFGLLIVAAVSSSSNPERYLDSYINRRKKLKELRDTRKEDHR